MLKAVIWLRRASIVFAILQTAWKQYMEEILQLIEFLFCITFCIIVTIYCVKSSIHFWRLIFKRVRNPYKIFLVTLFGVILAFPTVICGYIYTIFFLFVDGFKQYKKNKHHTGS